MIFFEPIFKTPLVRINVPLIVSALESVTPAGLFIVRLLTVVGMIEPVDCAVVPLNV